MVDVDVRTLEQEQSHKAPSPKPSSDEGGGRRSKARGRKGRSGASGKKGRGLVKPVDFTGDWQLLKIENMQQQKDDVFGNLGSVGKVFSMVWQRIGMIDYIAGKTGQKITQEGDRFSIVHHVLDTQLVKYDFTAGGPPIEVTIATGAKIMLQALWAEKKSVLVTEEMFSDGHMHPTTRYRLREPDLLQADVGASVMLYKRKTDSVKDMA